MMENIEVRSLLALLITSGIVFSALTMSVIVFFIKSKAAEFTAWSLSLLGMGIYIWLAFIPGSHQPFTSLIILPVLFTIALLLHYRAYKTVNGSGRAIWLIEAIVWKELVLQCYPRILNFVFYFTTGNFSGLFDFFYYLTIGLSNLAVALCCTKWLAGITKELTFSWINIQRVSVFNLIAILGTLVIYLCTLFVNKLMDNPAIDISEQSVNNILTFSFIQTVLTIALTLCVQAIQHYLKRKPL